MKLPTIKEMLGTLVSTPSVSCTSASQDQSNLDVIDHLATWLEDLGGRVERLPLPDNPAKANLIATFGSPGDGPGEQVLTRLEEIAQARKCKVNAQLLQARHAGPAIAMEAEDRKMDLIIVAIGHNQRVGAHPLGSTTSYLLRHAPCQVLIWRDSAPASALAER